MGLIKVFINPTSIFMDTFIVADIVFGYSTDQVTVLYYCHGTNSIVSYLVVSETVVDLIKQIS